MRDDDVIWEIPQQTTKKHEILANYLESWFAIMQKYSPELLYLDGFAGPNEYVGGQKGSPQIALDAAMANPHLYANKKLSLVFSELNRPRFDKLNRWATVQSETAPDYLQIAVHHTDFESMTRDLIGTDLFRRQPALFAFVDPFGVSVPIHLLAELTAPRKSELLVLFAFDFVNRFSTAGNVDRSLTELFGCDRFKTAPQGSPRDRKLHLVELYETQLRDVCGFKYVSRFEMVREDGKTTYFLMHCTRNPKGVEVFRETMWKADPVAGRRFSARDEYEGALFGSEQLINLDREIKKRFSGSTVSIEQLEAFVLDETPYKVSHLRKFGLKPLADAGQLKVLTPARTNSYPTGMKIQIL